jgi:hypothetical protein
MPISDFVKEFGERLSSGELDTSMSERSSWRSLTRCQLLGRRFLYRMDAHLRMIQEQVLSEKVSDRSLDSTVDPSIVVMFFGSPIGVILRELGLALDSGHKNLPLLLYSTDTIAMIRKARSIVRMAQCSDPSYVPLFSVDRDTGYPEGHVSPSEVESWLRKLLSIHDMAGTPQGKEIVKDLLGNIRALLEMILSADSCRIGGELAVDDLDFRTLALRIGLLTNPREVQLVSDPVAEIERLAQELLENEELFQGLVFRFIPAKERVSISGSLLRLFDTVEQALSGKKGNNVGMVRFYSEIDMSAWGKSALVLDTLLAQYITDGTGMEKIDSELATIQKLIDRRAMVQHTKLNRFRLIRGDEWQTLLKYTVSDVNMTLRNPYWEVYYSPHVVSCINDIRWLIGESGTNRLSNGEWSIWLNGMLFTTSSDSESLASLWAMLKSVEDCVLTLAAYSKTSSLLKLGDLIRGAWEGSESDLRALVKVDGVDGFLVLKVFEALIEKNPSMAKNFLGTGNMEEVLELKGTSYAAEYFKSLANASLFADNGHTFWELISRPFVGDGKDEALIIVSRACIKSADIVAKLAVPESARDTILELWARRKDDVSFITFVAMSRFVFPIGSITDYLEFFPDVIVYGGRFSHDELLHHARIMFFAEFRPNCVSVEMRLDPFISRSNRSVLTVCTSRDQLLQHSFELFEDVLVNLNSWKTTIEIDFTGEDGHDHGGLRKEWYYLVALEILKGDNGIMEETEEGSGRYTFAPISSFSGNDKDVAEFVGKFVAKAMIDKQVLPIRLSSAIYKFILEELDAVQLDLDMYSRQSPLHAQSLSWILENQVVEGLSFAVDFVEAGTHRIHDLVPGGSSIPVTEDNKHEYVCLMIEYKIRDSVRGRLENFLTGFHSVISRDILNGRFSSDELELLISGAGDGIDLEDIEANTKLIGYTDSSPQIEWFWEVISSFDQKELGLLVKFITGSPIRPPGGFAHLRGGPNQTPSCISIARVAVDTVTPPLPSSHTCINQLNLPEYVSIDDLRQKLRMAIFEAHEGFTFA